jgi:NADH:ubiquinone oxidoreductase subunit 5 (subunit L)/multisubunit Na+/H+ antiporter MnhA subunit
MGLNEVFSTTTLVFLLILFLGGFPVYITYYRKSTAMQKIRSRLLNFLTVILEHGYYFDDFYEGIVAKGVTESSTIVHNHIEQSIFNRLPQIAVKGITNLAHNTQNYLDFLADKLLYIAAYKSYESAAKINIKRFGSLEHFIAAALIGFFILLMLVMVTMLR